MKKRRLFYLMVGLPITFVFLVRDMPLIQSTAFLFSQILFAVVAGKAYVLKESRALSDFISAPVKWRYAQLGFAAATASGMFVSPLKPNHIWFYSGVGLLLYFSLARLGCACAGCCQWRSKFGYAHSALIEAAAAGGLCITLAALGDSGSNSIVVEYLPLLALFALRDGSILLQGYSISRLLSEVAIQVSMLGLVGMTSAPLLGDLASGIR